MKAIISSIFNIVCDWACETNTWVCLLLCCTHWHAAHFPPFKQTTSKKLDHIFKNKTFITIHIDIVQRPHPASSHTDNNNNRVLRLN